MFNKKNNLIIDLRLEVTKLERDKEQMAKESAKMANALEMEVGKNAALSTALENVRTSCENEIALLQSSAKTLAEELKGERAIIANLLADNDKMRRTIEAMKTPEGLRPYRVTCGEAEAIIHSTGSKKAAREAAKMWGMSQKNLAGFSAKRI